MSDRVLTPEMRALEPHSPIQSRTGLQKNIPVPTLFEQIRMVEINGNIHKGAASQRRVNCPIDSNGAD